jgi:hypothetical protein
VPLAVGANVTLIAVKLTKTDETAGGSVDPRQNGWLAMIISYELWFDHPVIKLIKRE